MSKLIDLKAELAVAQDNVETYFHIKKSIIEVMTKYPNANTEYIANTICEENDMKREDFDFVCNTERMMFEDFMKAQRRKK